MMLACFYSKGYNHDANGEESGDLYFLFHDFVDDAG
jgi:hypothetical protein